MPPAVIAAGVVAAGTIGGAVLGSKSQSKATAQAAQTQDNATAAQLQLGQESLGLNKDIYNSNYDILSPYVSRGNVAGGAINSLLGLPAAPAMHSPLATTAPTPTPGTTAPPPVPQVGGTPYPANAASLAANPAATDAANPLSAINARRAARGQPPVGHAGTTPTPSPAGAATAAHGTPASQAMQNFANSAGMQFQLQQGTNALNNLYAAHGMLQSGAAMKGINDYAQQTALNNYFMPYMGLLGGQQAVGAGAASSVAGVGANFGNTAANINNSMGNAINSGAQNIGNLQLANGQNQANMWGSIGGALGGLASSFVPVPKY